MITHSKGSDKELAKSERHIIIEIIEYVPDSIVCKTIIKKRNGNITATSFDEGEKLCEKTSEYDTYVQIIDGEADIIIDHKEHRLKLGEGIVIPAKSLHCFKAEEKFKMLTTIIKDINDEV